MTGGRGWGVTPAYPSIAWSAKGRGDERERRDAPLLVPLLLRLILLLPLLVQLLLRLILLLPLLLLTH